MMGIGVHLSRVGNGLQRTWWATRSLLIAVAFGSLAICALIPADRIVDFERLEQLAGPPKDYLPTEKKLLAEGEYGTAIALGDFMKDNRDLPNAETIIALRDQAEGDYNSYWSRTKRTASGFLTGNADSAQGMAGDFAANFLVYGNIRDLAKQGYHRAVGEPVDTVVVALSVAGLAADVAAYIPLTTAEGAPAEVGFSLLKALKRCGALTAKFAERIVELTKGARTVERMKELATCTLDVLKLYHRIPTGMIGPVMREVETTEELAKVTRLAENAPREVALVAKLGGHEGLEELKAADASESTLQSFLRVGKKSFIRVFRPTHVAVGLLKNLRLDKIDYFLHNVLPAKARLWLGWIAGALACAMLGNCGRHFLAIPRQFRKPLPKDTAKQSNEGDSSAVF
jgi:hypothetical protein